MIQREDVLSKIGRDIVIFWFLGFVLLSFHFKIEGAHDERMRIAGAFNTISLARAIVTQGPEDAISREELLNWYQPFRHLEGVEFDDITMPEGFGLGPLGTSFVVKIKSFGNGGSCQVLLRLVRVDPNVEATYMVHPGFDCIYQEDYVVFPTRLVFDFDKDGLGLIETVYFSEVWHGEFSVFLDSLSQPWCESFHCIAGEYEPVDFQVTPQSYFTDIRLVDEFGIPFDLLTSGPVREFILANATSDATMSDEVYAETLRDAETLHRRPTKYNIEEFFGFPVSVPHLPFLAILLAGYLTGSVLARALLLLQNLEGTGAGLLLGPARWWNFVQHLIKALMVVTPFTTVLLTGLVFQNFYRLSIIDEAYTNPLDGVLISFTHHIDMGRAMVWNEFSIGVFNVFLVVWLVAFIGAIACSALLLLTFRPAPK